MCKIQYYQKIADILYCYVTIILVHFYHFKHVYQNLVYCFVYTLPESYTLFCALL